jgi:hypothetical protein
MMLVMLFPAGLPDVALDCLIDPLWILPYTAFFS